MHILLIVGLLVFGISSSLGQLCVIKDVNLGQAYENAALNTFVGNIEVDGDVGVNITLTLGTEFAKYFKLDGKNILVKDSTTLDRSELPTAGTEFAVILGDVVCEVIGATTIRTMCNILMYFTNKEIPALTSSSSIGQSEITAPSTVITTLIADDGDNTGYAVTFSTEPSEYFEVDPTSGDVTLIKALNYDVAPVISLQVDLTDNGVDELGSPLSRTITKEVNITVIDYDNLNPIFLPCDEIDRVLCVPPLYTTNITVEQTGTFNNIEPQAIKAVDGDTAINTKISYSIFSGSAGYEKYFEIDSTTGVVTVKAGIPQEGTYLISIKATQDDNPSRFSIAWLEVDAYVPDDFKPVITNTASLSNAYVNDDGSEQLYVEDISGNRIQLNVNDDDGDATLIYTIDPPEPFQISSNGLIFAFRSDLFGSTRATVQDNFTITAVNIDASRNSPNRASDPVILDVTIIEMTTAATTEATTFPETTQATSFPITTTQETTEPTTLQTTASFTTGETSSTTDISTPGISTAPTSAEPTTVSITDESTTSETTTYSPTEATTVISTLQPSTQPEITTATTETSTIQSSAAFSTGSTDATVLSTTEFDTTVQSSSAIPVSTVQTDTSQPNDQTTFFSDAATTFTSITEPSTTQESSSAIPVSTLQTYTSIATDESSFVSGTATTQYSTDQTSAESSAIPTDVSTVTEISSTTSTMSTTAASDTAVASTASETAGSVTTSTSSFSSGEPSTTPSLVETTTTKSISSTPSTGDVFTTTPTNPPDIATTSEDISTARPITLSTTVRQATKDGTIIIEETVPKSTLIGVAVGLSCALFISILVIIYLLWKLMKKDGKTDEDDRTSETSSQTHQNDAYTEEDETADNDDTADKEPNGDVGPEVVGFTSGFTAPDTEESGVDMQGDPDMSSHEENDGDFIYEPANEPDVQEAVQDLEDAVSKEIGDNEDRPASANVDFEQELMDRANVMAATAAATALVAKAVEEPPEPEVPSEITPNLSPDVITNEEVIKEDVYHSVKLVMLKGCGDDGFDVKAVLKTIDTDMSTSADVNQVRKRISIMEQLSEMDHPNILKYYGCFVTNDTINYALRYAENGNLRDKLASGSLSSHEMMLIMANVGKGLQYLHAKNVTHGNIWAKAVMLDGMNTPMLTDIEGSSKTSSEYKEIMRWQSVEVLNQTSKTSPATDVWSFGVLMWEVASQGATPYKDVPLQELTKKIEKEQLKKPKGCSDSLFSVMENCWKKNPKLRDDMYGVNNRLSELLLEDSNEHIQLNQGGEHSSGSPDDSANSHHSDFESNAEFTAL